MTRGRSSVALIATVALAACAKTPNHGRAPTFLDELGANPAAFVAEVAKHRGAETPAVPLKLDDDDAFGAAVKAKIVHDALAPMAGDTIAFALGFGFSNDGPPHGPEVPRQRDAPSVTGDALSDEQLLGFYDQVTREIHVRRSKLVRPGKHDDATTTRFVLAHEIGHAIQHGKLGPRLMPASGGEDARLAWNAVLEGEASLTALAHLAARSRRPLRRFAARVGDIARSAQANGLMKGDPESRALRAAPALERERLLFPYEAGLAFIGDLYRAGGMPLVEGAFARPPSTTEQILSPRRYLDGELAVPVATPSPPAGFSRVVEGAMGQFLTGVVLERCLPRDRARGAATDWGGDAFSIVVSDAREVGVLWSTTWDTEAAAIGFADALTRARACFERPSAANGHRVSGHVTVARDGKHVAFVRGLGETSHASVVAALLTLPRPPLPKQPIAGDLVIPPVAPKPVPGPWLRGFGTWDNPYLGLRVPAWEGFTAESGDEPTSLTLKRRGDLNVTAIIELSDEPPTTASQAALFDTFGRAIGTAVQSSLHVVGNGPFGTPLGVASARTFAVPGTRIRAQVIAIPVCRAQGTLVVAEGWTDAAGETAAAELVRQMTTLGIDRPPVCDELDP